MSKVNFTFSLHIPGDKKDDPEFEILPHRYKLRTGETKDIKISFTPIRNSWKYDQVLVVNIDGVGDDMLSIPIHMFSPVKVIGLMGNLHGKILMSRRSLMI